MPVFQYGDVRLELVTPTMDTLWKQACYLTRVIRARFTNREVNDVPQTEWQLAEQFAVILAHVSNVQGFPFSIPEPNAPLQLIGAAWDHFLKSDPQLWTAIIQQIEMPSAELRQAMGSLLMKAHKDLDEQLESLQANQPHNGKAKP